MSIFTGLYNWLFDPDRAYRVLAIARNDVWLDIRQVRFLYRKLWGRGISTSSLRAAIEVLELGGWLETKYGTLVAGGSRRAQLVLRTDKGRHECRLWLERYIAVSLAEIEKEL